MSNQVMNSKEYWNNRFTTDWEENKGRGQTAFFGQLALNMFPEWFVREVVNHKLSIADIGCAEGDATQLLSQKFVDSEVVGIDFSEEAIERAQFYYPNLHFKSGDVNHLTEKYDVIFSSNTLEHFSNPISIMEKLTENSEKFMVFLIPFQEYSLIEEHFFTFDYKSFPLKLKNYLLVFYQEIDCTLENSSYWQDKQIMVIYSNELTVDYSNFSIESANGNIPIINRHISSLTNIQNKLINEVNEKTKVIEKLENNTITLQENISRLENNLQGMEKESQLLSQRVFRSENELDKIYNSGVWKLALKYYKVRDTKPFLYIYKSAKIIKSSGVKVFLRKLYDKIFVKNKTLHSFQHQRQLKQILRKHKNKQIIVFPHLVDWNIPLFQRPQHIALKLAQQGFLYFYCSPNSYDNVNGFQKIDTSCYLTNRLDLLMGLNSKKIIHLYSTDMNPTNDLIKQSVENGDLIFYEYIDEIHEELSGSIPEFVIQKHDFILKNEKCAVVASANKLYDEVKSVRTNNFELVTNGVDYNHFRKNYSYEDAPAFIKSILDKKSSVIGYYGAFASWFDYELIIKLATERPDYQILLIGWKYDSSMDQFKLNEYDNISIIGPIDYKVLPEYAYWFDVSIIPFKINDITDSTSPIKLFEYMALGRPIVTTDMPECRKYKSVLIGKNSNEFIKLIDKSLTLKGDKQYEEILEKEALENTWDSKAEVIAGLLRQNL
ncbi:MAG: methyltransferase domain-containing protein [Bacillota bacterium]